jgi:dCMP deaminase
MPRPKFTDIYMDLAKQIAERSDCFNRSVGCVIASLDNERVLSIGYNGGAKGSSETCSSKPSIGFQIGTSRCQCVHAEMNALNKLNYNDPSPKRLFVTLSPCILCAKLIVNANIDEVVYLEEYKDSSGIFILEEAAIKVMHYENN